jgi:peroxiredoxin
METEFKVGQKAPAFSLPRDGGGSVSLAQFKGRKLVLYFYPRADTPGCTRESIDFSKLRAAFDQASTDILGVSADPVKAQDAFKKKHELTIGLLSDETHQMLEAYGAWGGKIDVRQELHGGSSLDRSNRPGRPHCPDLAEGEGRGACRRGAQGRQSALTKVGVTRLALLPGLLASPRRIRGILTMMG